MTKYPYKEPKDFIEAYRQGLEHSQSDEIYKTVEVMDQFGGNFVRALSNAWRCADPINKRKLVGAFSEYFADYYQKSLEGWGQK